MDNVIEGRISNATTGHKLHWVKEVMDNSFVDYITVDPNILEGGIDVNGHRQHYNWK